MFYDRVLGAGVHSFLSVYQLFSCHFTVFFNPHQPIHEAQIYFAFLWEGNPKTALKGGYLGWLCKLFGKLWSCVCLWGLPMC
jgi:hypothetical protein